MKKLPPPPRVVHCKREPFDVYIGRGPLGWGNPFIIGPDGDRWDVVRKYRAWVMRPEKARFRERVKKELSGKVLGCWCAPKACHGDILLEIANS